MLRRTFLVMVFFALGAAFFFDAAACIAQRSSCNWYSHGKLSLPCGIFRSMPASAVCATT